MQIGQRGEEGETPALFVVGCSLLDDRPSSPVVVDF